ncbi:hypothetical protein QKU48_gp0361 [Fadolivirus algeromassiliense]|uniref:Uncharacterized protein n=1 Tax=Fadolivirus FV1/VV64 TaxID=3070911 RepID=A0A7D3QVR2_9VIRU|nr:hypothetical protein QKU48_gp0361 [Fadolivirus algeromassiliense]QKF93819.1 hypothetical protein Fadolivirus_1_361 [Fadolivirus FV1/VV64]
MKDSALLSEMLRRQLKNVPADKKLKYNDLKRLCKYINSNIFDESTCCLWNGYITNIKNESKGVYINFYFRGKKAALHRLLYINFVGELTDDEYLKFSCENKGKCCNIAHLNKFKYTKKETIKQISQNEKTTTNLPLQVSNKNSFVLNFD